MHQLVRNKSKGVCFVQTTRWPRTAWVERRLIFWSGGQVSHGLRSRWLEGGHNVVTGGGSACWNPWTTAEREVEHIRGLCRFTPRTAPHLWNLLSNTSNDSFLCERDSYDDPQEVAGWSCTTHAMEEYLNHLCHVCTASSFLGVLISDFQSICDHLNLKWCYRIHQSKLISYTFRFVVNKTNN